MDKSLNTLTPLCDFVARIDNEGHEPTLVAFETVDTKGNWQVISDRFAKTYHDPSAFPQSKPRLRLRSLDPRLAQLIKLRGEEKAAYQQAVVSLDSLSCRADSQAIAEIFGSNIMLAASQQHTVAWHPHAKLPIPKNATSAFWIYPWRPVTENFVRHVQQCEALQDDGLKTFGHMMLYGGFAFYHNGDVRAPRRNSRDLTSGL